MLQQISIGYLYTYHEKEAQTMFSAVLRLNTVLSAVLMNASRLLQVEHVRRESPRFYVQITRAGFAVS